MMLAAGLLLSPTWGLAAEPKEERPDGGTVEMKNVFECLKACNASIEEAEDYCRNLPDNNKKRKALCWSAIYAGKAACQVFCRAEFGPPIRH
ncbi:hypothetical protein [Archangium sp.]|uniref:hypothetical protein n=1 Tax=Archangium sp. TaxID=1872627 RepID=UPI003899C1F0